MINFRMRKLLARIALPILSIWLCILPSRSYAFVPAAVGLYGVSTAAESAAAVAAAGGVGGTAGAAAFAAAGAFALGASALAVGATMGYLIVDNLTGDLVRIPLTTANPAPPPSAPATSTPIPTTVYYVSGYIGDTKSAACLNAWTSTGGNLGGGYFVEFSQVSPDGTMCWGRLSPGGSFYIMAGITTGQIAACGSGYVASGSNCNLSNPRAVTSDKTKDYQRTGTTLEPFPNDIDTASADVSALPSGALLIQDKTASGEPRHYKIIPQTDGGSNVEIYEPVTNAVGDTGTKKVVISVSPSGTVTGKTQTTTGEQLGQDPATGLPVLNPAPSGTTFNPSSPSGSAITFPSDYARTGEASNAADGIKTKLDTLHGDLSSTTNIGDPVEPTSGDMPGWGSTFSGLLGWQLPAHGSSCPTPSLDLAFMGLGSHAMTMHCTLINNHFDALNAAMMVVWTVLALFVVLRA